MEHFAGRMYFGIFIFPLEQEPANDSSQRCLIKFKCFEI